MLRPNAVRVALAEGRAARYAPEGMRSLNGGRDGVPFCAIPRTPADHEAWRARGVTAFVVGEERSVAARALRGHLADHRGPVS